MDIKTIWNYLTGDVNNKKEQFMSADEAYQKALRLKHHTREEFKKRMIKSIQFDIRRDIQNPICKLCVINTYHDVQSKEILPEIAEHFSGLGYDVKLLNGETYRETNILIINYQNRALFNLGE